jgi:hypothetical protein
MKKNVFSILIAVLSIANLQAQLKPIGLTTDMMENPLCIENMTPQLGWKLVSDKQGDLQTAYQIVVTSEESKQSRRLLE